MSSTEKHLTLHTGPQLEPKQVVTEKGEEAKAEAKRVSGTTQEQNGDVQSTTKVNEISHNVDPRPRIHQQPNGDLPHAIKINGGSKPELEADKTMTALTQEEDKPYQMTSTSTNSVADTNATAHANPVVDGTPSADAKPEIDAHPVADAHPVVDANLVADVKPVTQSNLVGDPTSVAGNTHTLPDTSTMASLKPTAGEVSKAYIAEDGMTDKVAETSTESKVH